MKQKAGGMQQAMGVATEAAGVDHDKVTIAADDAGATAAAQKMGRSFNVTEIRIGRSPDRRKHVFVAFIGVHRNGAGADQARPTTMRALTGGRMRDKNFGISGQGKDR